LKPKYRKIGDITENGNVMNWMGWGGRGGGLKTVFIYRRPTLYPLEIAVDFLKSL
jgi:hypothetical protein